MKRMILWSVGLMAFGSLFVVGKNAQAMERWFKVKSMPAVEGQQQVTAEKQAQEVVPATAAKIVKKEEVMKVDTAKEAIPKEAEALKLEAGAVSEGTKDVSMLMNNAVTANLRRACAEFYANAYFTVMNAPSSRLTQSRMPSESPEAASYVCKIGIRLPQDDPDLYSSAEACGAIVRDATPKVLNYGACPSPFFGSGDRNYHPPVHVSLSFSDSICIKEEEAGGDDALNAAVACLKAAGEAYAGAPAKDLNAVDRTGGKNTNPDATAGTDNAQYRYWGCKCCVYTRSNGETIRSCGGGCVDGACSNSQENPVWAHWE